MVLVLTACNQGADNQAVNQATGTPEETDAVAIYKKQCLSCHAADLSGRVGPNLQKVGSNLTEERLVNIIHDGAKGMPAFKKILSAEDIGTLAKWLSNHR